MKKQGGFTLISLLVGLLISSFLLIGMMMVYRNTIQVVVPASESSRSYGERVSALLSTNMMLQAAGFGIENSSYGSHLRIFKSSAFVPLAASEGSVASGDTVLWLSKDFNGTQCRGLSADGEGGLWQVSCDLDMQNIKLSSRLILPSQYGAEQAPPITIVAKRVTCYPFSTDISGRLKLILVFHNSVARQIESSTCLLNFVS